MVLGRAQYLHALDVETHRMVSAVQEGLQVPVLACPGWTVGHVLAHVGRGYNWIGEMARERALEPTPMRPQDHSFDPRDPTITFWFEASFARFRDTLESMHEDEPMWSWSGEKRAGFWLRLMAHETAIHRVDTQSAHGEPEPIAAELAADAINGMLAWFLPDCRSNSLLPSRGERYSFCQTDGGDYWLLTFEGNSVSVRREPDEADVTIEAPASDILLFLWHRLPPERLPASGNRQLLERYRDLVPSW